MTMTAPTMPRRADAKRRRTATPRALQFSATVAVTVVAACWSDGAAGSHNDNSAVSDSVMPTANFIFDGFDELLPRGCCRNIEGGSGAPIYRTDSRAGCAARCLQVARCRGFEYDSSALTGKPPIPPPSAHRDLPIQRLYTEGNSCCIIICQVRPPLQLHPAPTLYL